MVGGISHGKERATGFVWYVSLDKKNINVLVC